MKGSPVRYGTTGLEHPRRAGRWLGRRKTIIAVGAVVLATACAVELRLGQRDGDPGSSSLGGASSGGGSPDPSGGASPGLGGAEPGVDLGVPCPTGSLFCSGFEVPHPEQWTNSQVNGDGAVLSVVSAPTHSGNGALSSHIGDGAENARVEYVFDEPITSGVLSARAHFYLTSDSILQGTIIAMEFGGSTSGGKNKTSINLDVDRSLRLVTTTGLEPTAALADPQAYDADTWNCAVLTVVIGDPGSITVELDGSEIIAVSGNTAPEGGWVRFLLGALGSATDPPVDLYWDSVAIRREPLTCP